MGKRHFMGKATFTFWKVLFDCTMSIICHDNATWLQNMWYEVVANLFGCLAVLHANAASVVDVAQISNALRQVSLDDALLVKCAEALDLNHVAASDIVRMFEDAGMPLADVAQRCAMREEADTIRRMDSAGARLRRLLEKAAAVPQL